MRPVYAGRRQAPVEQNKLEPAERGKYFEAAWEEYCALIGRNPKQKIATPKKPTKRNANHRRLAVISDTHGRPHQAGIEAMLREKPDRVLVAGDVYDLMAVSRFDKAMVVPVEEDIANVRAMVERIASECDVALAQGNHDKRMWKYFTQRVSTEYMRFVFTDMLSLAIQGISNASIAYNLHGFTSGNGHNFGEMLETSFLIFEGDAVFGHAEIAMRHELTSVRKLREWYNIWRKPLDWTEAVVIGQAHTHRAGIGYPAGGHAIDVELGCMLHPSVVQYQMDGDARYVPPTIGYTILEQHREHDKAPWKTDRNSVQFTLC